jgi:PAS domain S-box-containing protein
MTANILIVEDESLIAEEIARRLRQMGHTICGIVDNARDAFALVSVVRPDMALVDINIKGTEDGIAVARRLKNFHDVPVIFLTAHADPATLREATETEPYGFIVKPFDQRGLAAALQIALRRRHAEQQIMKLERWLAATMTSIGDGVIATDSEYRVVLMNPVAEHLGRWRAEDAIGKSVTDVFVTDGVGSESLSATIARAAETGVAIQLDDRMLLRADGTSLSIDDSVSPIRDEAGRINGVVIVFRDATPRKEHERKLAELNAELERQVQRRTAQLEAANAELATFSYSIAHDLRAPLRAIIGFASRVVVDHSNTLDVEGRRLLEVVTSRAGQMARMIDDYLRLSGLTSIGLHHKELSMNMLARDAWAFVTSGVERVPSLVIGSLPDAYGDEGLLRQVWINLLSNAVKFTRHASDPTVYVSGRIQGDRACFVVQDNGAGFDPEHAGKLFRVFERLHTQNEFEGSGIGLCIVQRILHRHEGDITITGQRGEGARVEFWMPRRPSTPT